jgi:bifunctional non-homologous end joining protein LigD
MAGRRSLQEYARKRDFAQTPEPDAAAPARAGQHRYLIQKHAARRLHYDFRLEHRGVLLSWAVTRGPSLDPAQKRLAVRTEDHPLAYGDFEGVIPSGYGAGTVLLWDTGIWEAAGDIDAGLEKGVLKFTLHGRRLRGGWALVRMKPRRRTDRENWLLVKERDDHASSDTDPLVTWTSSVVSGLDLEEMGKSRSPGKAAPFPAFRRPQLAVSVDAPPEGSEWIHEVKYDGYRIQAQVAGNAARLLTRNGHDWTSRYPFIARALSGLTVGSAVLDGELVALDAEGRSRFSLLADQTGARLAYFAFDLLEEDGACLADQPLHKRKARLRELLGSGEGPLRFSDHLEGDGAQVARAACRMELEGIVSKRRTGRYRPGRHDSWQKSKCVGRDEFVIAGYRRSDKPGRPFASLLVGDYSGNDLIYRGRVGTGFDAADLDRLAALMKPLIRKTPAFSGLPATARRGAVWIEPRLVAEIAYPEKTSAGLLRHPAFLGLREDKTAREVTLQQKRTPAPAAARPAPASHGVGITHASRIVIPEAGLTKGDVAGWYDRAATHILPWLKGRPVSLLRCPSGVTDGCFFQKHAGQLPPQIRRVRIEEKRGGSADYLTIADRDGLLQAAQMGMIELHGWGALADRIERPDRMVFDLDPDAALPFLDVVRAAERIRDILAEAGLASFPLVTGGKGVHVFVPLERRQTWEDVASVSRGIARSLAGAAPESFVATASLEKRKGRIFIDWLRNRRGATAIIPFSLRARPAAAIAAPVSWEELAGLPGADVFGPEKAPGRLEPDPWRGIDSVRQSLTRPVVSVFSAF